MIADGVFRSKYLHMYRVNNHRVDISGIVHVASFSIHSASLEEGSLANP